MGLNCRPRHRRGQSRRQHPWHPTWLSSILTSDSRFENEVMGYAPIYDRTYLVIVFGPSSPGCSFSEPKRANLTRDRGNERLDERVEMGGFVLLLRLGKNQKGSANCIGSSPWAVMGSRAVMGMGS